MGPRHLMARFYAQHVIICRQAASLSRSLLGAKDSSARANSQASFTPTKALRFLVQTKLGAAVGNREDEEKASILKGVCA